jgi:8-oxo-dGTP pyrophosphatase MutT (NUDIX family)
MTDRMMLSFVTETRRFNYRTAGIAIRDEHILICREDDDDYTLLPGGRVEFGERSDLSLAREVQEELKTTGEVGDLLFSVENFFHRDGQDFHEMAHYYALQLPDAFPFVSEDVCLVTQDEGHDLHFAWVPLDDSRLGEWNLLPRWLRTRLQQLPERSEHLIVDER